MVWICEKNLSHHGKKTQELIPLWMPSAVEPSQNFRQKRQELRSSQSWRGNRELGQSVEKVLRCKLVLGKGRQGQWPKCSEDLVPSRGLALPGPWQWDNCGSGHFMPWGSLLSWPPSAGAHHGKMNTQISPQFIIVPCSLAMPGFQHWCSWKSLSPAQCLGSERLKRAVLHRNVHNEV